MKEIFIKALIVLVQALMCIFTVPFVLSVLVGGCILTVVAIAVGLIMLPGYLMCELNEWLNKFV